MKIGIITTHFAINYGAVLQAYALRKTIDLLGHNCEIINYTPPNRVDGRNLVYNLDTLKSTIYSIILFLNIKFRINTSLKIKKFNSFLKHNCRMSSESYVTFSQLKSNIPFYESLVCGSDQIWNLNLFNDPAFFLRFEDIYPETNYIAYAPSIAEKMTKAQINIIAENIQHFSSLSMREHDSAKEMSAELDREIETVLDPVFLLKPEEWQIIEEPVDVDEPYILNYALLSGSEYSKVLKYVRKKIKHKLVTINLHPFDKHNSDYSFSSLSPGNYVWLFRNAEFICTSSFHGTAFSILFEKQFFTIPAPTRSARIENILKLLGLENRLITDSMSVENVYANHIIDYGKAYSRLLMHRDNCMEYLQKAIAKPSR